ncbi:hypothetical protein GWI34_20905 [Actinomadura sp. DSM 109109]|nr:hypothetical protein [Actinomadura lepetitiana]
MRKHVLYVLFAVALGAFFGTFVGGVIESLDHTAQVAGASLRTGGVPAGTEGSDVMAGIFGAGLPDHFFNGAVGGLFGLAVPTVRGAYRAARDAARDNWGPVIAGGAVLAIAVSTGIVPVDGVGLLTAASGFAAGTGVGAIAARA